MSILRARFAGATIAVLLVSTVFALGTSSANPGGDVHYFEVGIAGSGSASADFGEDRFRPGVNTGFGVDGKESVSWQWEVRAVAQSVGTGPLVTRAKTSRERAVLDVSLLNYTIQQGVVGTTPLCADRQGSTTFVSNDGRGARAEESGRGEFIHKGFFGLSGGGNLDVNPPGYAAAYTCSHGTSAHGLLFVDGTAYDNNARVPRGAFNPRSDRSFNKTFRSPHISLGRDHEFDAAVAHTFEADSVMKLEIDAISERRFNKLVKRFQHIPVGPGDGATEYHAANQPYGQTLLSTRTL